MGKKIEEKYQTRVKGTVPLEKNLYYSFVAEKKLDTYVKLKKKVTGMNFFPLSS